MGIGLLDFVVIGAIAIAYLWMQKAKEAGSAAQAAKRFFAGESTDIGHLAELDRHLADRGESASKRLELVGPLVPHYLLPDQRPMAQPAVCAYAEAQRET